MSIALFTALIFLFPIYSYATTMRSVVINEVAWSGTKASSADEWVELYNTTLQSIDLTDWTLIAVDETPDIELSGVIPPGGYFLLERTNDTTINDIIANIIYIGALSNSGEHLILKDADGNIIDSVNASGGWTEFGGSASPDYFSMERIDSLVSGDDPANWQSNDGVTRNGTDAATPSNPINGTPMAENSAGVILSESEESQGGDTSTAEADQNDTNDGDSSDIDESEVQNDGVDSSVASLPQNDDGSLRADAGDDIFTFLGETIQFDASKSVSNKSVLISQNPYESVSNESVSYKWNLGNGEIINEKIFGYVYRFPGKYIVTLTISDEVNSSTDEAKIEVLSGGIKISEFVPNPKGADGENEWIEISNTSNFLVDLGGWRLDDVADGGSKPWTFPSNTFIAPNSYLVISREISGVALNNNSDAVRLIYPNGVVADEIIYEKSKEGESGVLMGGRFFWSDFPTPGMPNILEAEISKVSGAKPINSYFVESFSEAYQDVIYSDNNTSGKNKTNLVIMGSNDNNAGVLEEVSFGNSNNQNQLGKFAPSKNMLQASVGSIFSLQDVTLIIIISLLAGAGALYLFFQIKQKKRLISQTPSQSQKQFQDDIQTGEQGGEQNRGEGNQGKRSWELFVDE